MILILCSRRQTPNISHSDPIPSLICPCPRPIWALPSTSQHFPICDDMNDIVDFDAPSNPTQR
jgi:hypothetical protein